MKLTTLALAALPLMSTVALASEPAPWVCYGSAAVTFNTTVIDPPPAVNGLMGECGRTPFVVPAGHVLVLQSIGIEGYPQLLGAMALSPLVGSLPPTNNSFLLSVQSGQGVGSNRFDNANMYLPAGTQLHVLLQGGQWPEGQDPTGYTPVFGWYMSGVLISTEQ